MGSGNKTTQKQQTISVNQPLQRSGSENKQIAVARQPNAKRCILTVPEAPTNVIGNCVYYYRPYPGDFINKTGVNFKQVLDYAVTISPFDIPEATHIFYKLIKRSDPLIPSNSTDPNWSRWHNFCARHTGCGHRPPPYYIAYGYYYCSNFGAYLLPRMKSSAGVAWLNTARRLLHTYMEDGLQQNNNSSNIHLPSARYPNKSVPTLNVPIKQLELIHDKFKTFAYNSHVPAYLDGGIADVPIADLMRVFGQPNVEEWIDLETWKQAKDVAWEVVPHKISQPWETTKEVGDAAWQAGTYVFEENATKIRRTAGYVKKAANGTWEWVKSIF